MDLMELKIPSRTSSFKVPLAFKISTKNCAKDKKMVKTLELDQGGELLYESIKNPNIH